MRTYDFDAARFLGLLPSRGSFSNVGHAVWLVRDILGRDLFYVRALSRELASVGLVES